MKEHRISQLPFVPNRHRLRIAANVLGERLHGLDFTMPDRLYDRHRNDGAMYYATPDRILQSIFSCIDIRKFPRFLDIGCGKGYVLWQAAKYGFPSVGGVEYDHALCDTCRKNMGLLGLPARLAWCDAREYPHYGEYDVFYFFNPFVEEIMHSVIDRIVAQCAGREIMLVYYRPRYTDYIESCGFFEKTKELFDPVNRYSVNIYRGWIPKV